MSDADLIRLIDRLRASPTEREWFDFTREHCEPERIGAYRSARANSAYLECRPHGYLVFGVDDAIHAVTAKIERRGGSA